MKDEGVLLLYSLIHKCIAGFSTTVCRPHQTIKIVATPVRNSKQKRRLAVSRQPLKEYNNTTLYL